TDVFYTFVGMANQHPEAFGPYFAGPLSVIPVAGLMNYSFWLVLNHVDLLRKRIIQMSAQVRDLIEQRKKMKKQLVQVNQNFFAATIKQEWKALIVARVTAALPKKQLYLRKHGYGVEMQL